MWSPTWTETGEEKPLEMMWEKLIQEPLWFVQCFPSPCSTWERKTIWEGDKWVAKIKNSTQIQGFICSSFLSCPPVVSPGPVQARVVSQNKGHAGRMVSQQFLVHRLGRAGVGETFRSASHRLRIHGWKHCTALGDLQSWSHRMEWFGLGENLIQF